jgi:hypothetical protein
MHIGTCNDIQHTILHDATSLCGQIHNGPLTDAVAGHEQKTSISLFCIAILYCTGCLGAQKNRANLLGI